MASPDSSGQHFINLASTLTSRDNIRQAVANLIALTRAVPTLDLDGNPATGDIDDTRMHFFGWSLGGIVGSAYVGTPARGADQVGRRCSPPAAESWRRCASRRAIRPCSTMVLRPPASPPGTSIYWEFVHAAQAAVESGDGCNYTANWIAQADAHADDPGHAGCRDQADGSGGAELVHAASRESARRCRPSRRRPRTRPASRGLTRFTEGGHGTIAMPSPAPADACVVHRGPHAARLVPRLRRRADLGHQLGDTRAAISFARSRKSRAAFGPLFFSPILSH